MTTQYRGALKRNPRRRTDRDPAWSGWIDFKNGRASIGGWSMYDDDKKVIGLRLTAAPWQSKKAVFSKGSLLANDNHKRRDHPELIGTLRWSSTNFTIAAFMNRDKDTNELYLKVTAREVTDARADCPLL